MNEKILVVEDERSIADIIIYNPKIKGYKPVHAADGAEGLRMAIDESPDLMLLDVMLPEMDGFEVCKKLRERGESLPIIMLTAREEESDKVMGLDLGADDYITKPFTFPELFARIRANLRRNTPVNLSADATPTPSKNSIAIGELIIDPDAVDVYRGSKALGLTQREFDLIYFLARSRGKVFSRADLMNKVWEYDSAAVGDDRTVDVTVRRLREKIEPNPAEPQYVVTKRGLGYMMN